MGSGPGNLVAFDEAGSDVVDSTHRPRRRIESNDHAGLHRLRRPSLPAHFRNDGFAKHARVLQPAVPLSNRSLPFAYKHGGRTKRSWNVAADGGRNNNGFVEGSLRQRDGLSLRDEHVPHARRARGKLEWDGVELERLRQQLAGERLLPSVEVAIRRVGVKRNAIEVERQIQLRCLKSLRSRMSNGQ